MFLGRRVPPNSFIDLLPINSSWHWLSTTESYLPDRNTTFILKPKIKNHQYLYSYMGSQLSCEEILFLEGFSSCQLYFSFYIHPHSTMNYQSHSYSANNDTPNNLNTCPTCKYFKSSPSKFVSILVSDVSLYPAIRTSNSPTFGVIFNTRIVFINFILNTAIPMTKLCIFILLRFGIKLPPTVISMFTPFFFTVFLPVAD